MLITTEKTKYLIGEVLELGEEAFQSYRNELKHLPIEDEQRQTPDAKHHFLLTVGEYSPDGIIVDLSGDRYESIPAFIPDARKQLDAHIKSLADYCVSEGLDNTEDGRWSVTYDELYHHFDGTTIASRNGMGRLLREELRQRDEINELIMTEDCIEMSYHMEYCQSCQEGGIGGTLNLLSLMGCNLYDVHLCDSDEDHELATVVELNQDTLTEDGKREWSDVLNAKVTSIYEGHYGVQIGLTGCPAERLRDFSFMLAGHCSAKDYDRWVNSDTPEQAQTESKQSM